MDTLGENCYLFILIKTFIFQPSLFGEGLIEDGRSGWWLRTYLFESFAEKGNSKKEGLPDGDEVSTYIFPRWKL